uniref:Uncharacterized protein n=1 Tax=Solanum lycopersicum TaxID=4081 RepID=K4BRJ5_SOLLC
MLVKYRPLCLYVLAYAIKGSYIIFFRYEGLGLGIICVV